VTSENPAGFIAWENPLMQLISQRKPAGFCPKVTLDRTVRVYTVEFEKLSSKPMMD